MFKAFLRALADHFEREGPGGGEHKPRRKVEAPAST
jgi:hypothetical protein